MLYPFFDKYFLFPIAEKFQKSSILKHYRFLKKTEWWSRDKIDQLRDEKIRKLVTHAYHQVPYYKELFDSNEIRPEDISGFNDLDKIPVLTKQIIRDNYDKMFSLDISDRNIKMHSSGGSTGVPLQFITDMDNWNSSWASTFRAWDSYGFKLGEKIFTIGGHSLVQDKKRISKGDIWEKVLMRNYKYSSSEMNDKDMAKYYKEFIKLKPRAMRGYASSMYVFAKYIENNNLPIHQMVCILTTGEVLLDEYRRKIMDVFNVDVFDGYGAADGGIRSHECPEHKGLHITEEDCVIEICHKGKRLADGETGHVVTTDLNNYAFPFIRYEVGDMAYIKPEFCTCGRKTYLIGEVMGRAGKLVFSKIGVPISPTMLPVFLYPNNDYNNVNNIELHNKIDKYQFVQDDKGDIVVRLKMKNSARYKESEYLYIICNIEKALIGSKAKIEFVDAILPLPSGKEDFVISKFKRK